MPFREPEVGFPFFPPAVGVASRAASSTAHLALEGETPSRNRETLLLEVVRDPGAPE